VYKEPLKQKELGIQIQSPPPMINLGLIPKRNNRKRLGVNKSIQLPPLVKKEGVSGHKYG